MKRGAITYGILILLIVAAALGALAWATIQRGFSAKDEPSAGEAYLARSIRYLSVPHRARAATNPLKFSPAVLSQAMEHFADHCAICHGNDGKGNTLIGRGLYPRPTDMTLDATQQLTDGELYYIIENGVRLTGMPAFGAGTDDAPDSSNEESWALVHFIRHLPKLTVEEVQAMKTMNPKSPAETAKEEKLRRFLEGNDTALPGTDHDHHD